MYNEYFGFLESPFGITPDTHFFYASPTYREVYANLRYGINAKKGFVSVTGEVGTGKTTLLRKLAREFDTTIHFALIFNTEITFDELLRVTLHDLRLPTDGKSKLALFQDLNTYLIEQLERGHTVCLLIDEAQALAHEALEGLRLLSNLETDREKLLQVVLMGQPELKAKLDQPNLRQLKQRIAIQCEIVPLTDEEVGSYIEFRLQVAGYVGKDLFESEAVREIARYSQGIPRLINVICDNALLIAFAGSQKTVSVDVIREVARDLRLGSEAGRIGDKNAFPVSVPAAEKEAPIPQATNPIPQRKGRRRIMILLFILLLASWVFLSDPQTFFTGALRTSEFSKPELTEQQPVVVTRQKTLPQKFTAEIDFKRKDRRVIVQYGSTVSKIAADAYGANVILGMDLIKEFNPQIQNLNWVAAGEDLLLPVLGRETLLRPQPDGSYRLIVASFLGRTGAIEFARRIMRDGYEVLIIQKRVSNDLLLYRLEIDGLKNLEQANRTLKTGLENKWLTLEEEQPTEDQGSEQDATY